MARPQIVCYLDRVSGVNGARKALSDATVTILDAETDDEFDIYDSPTGGSLLTPPFTTSDEGLVIHSSSDDLYADRARQSVIAGTKNAVTVEKEIPLMTGRDLGGRVIDRAERGAPSPTSTATYTSWTDITELTLTLDGDEINGDVNLVVEGPGASNSVSAQTTFIAIREGATVLRSIGVYSPAVSAGSAYHFELFIEAWTGERTFKVSFTRAGSSGTASLAAGDIFGLEQGPILFYAREA